jgi:hypothetical protein
MGCPCAVYFMSYHGYGGEREMWRQRNWLAKWQQKWDHKIGNSSWLLLWMLTKPSLKNRAFQLNSYHSFKIETFSFPFGPRIGCHQLPNANARIVYLNSPRPIPCIFFPFSWFTLALPRVVQSRREERKTMSVPTHRNVGKQCLYLLTVT